MSQIFDALQKAEGGDAGTDSPTPPEATELLQRAERKAAARWEAKATPDRGVASAPEESVGVPPRAAEAALDGFEKIQRLQVSLAPQSRLVCLTEGDSPASEAFRLLGVRLRQMRRDNPMKRVLITSTSPQEGKSMVAANLACTLALKAELKVLLVEGDLRRPSLTQMFAMEGKPGLCECLESDRPVAKSLYYLEGPNLWMLPAGSASSNALDLLQAGRLPALMDQLGAWFDWIIIDAPPVLPLADTSVWTRIAEGILLVTRPGVTRKQQLLKGVEALDVKKLLGALVNCSRLVDHDDYNYYYRGSPNVLKTNYAPAK
jgi:capsular exopolysaccharide synthesis family protein